jgi:hypothetical protein
MISVSSTGQERVGCLKGSLPGADAPIGQVVERNCLDGLELEDVAGENDHEPAKWQRGPTSELPEIGVDGGQDVGIELAHLVDDDAYAARASGTP